MILRISLLALILFSTAAHSRPEGEKRIDDLVKRIEALEQRVAEQERRIENLEQELKNVKKQSKQDPWQELRQGMRLTDVEQLLGKPSSIRTYRAFEFDYVYDTGRDGYGQGVVKFKDSRVTRWTPPSKQPRRDKETNSAGSSKSLQRTPTSGAAELYR